MISGLVAYLTADPELSAASLRAIREQPSIELGTQMESRLPLVLETATSSESQTITDWLIGLPGIEHVDVAFVHLDEQMSVDSTVASQSNGNSMDLRN